jgi:formate/nitrite transporter FocA (FNT family)
MRVSWRDGLATLFVGVGACFYVSWLSGAEVTGVSGTKVVGAVILGLGLAASVTAVVYGVGAGLLHASKTYLVIASLVGLTALVAGVAVLVTANEIWLGALMGATVVLWLISTVRHAMIARGDRASNDAAAHQHFANAA